MRTWEEVRQFIHREMCAGRTAYIPENQLAFLLGARTDGARSAEEMKDAIIQACAERALVARYDSATGVYAFHNE